MNPRPTLSPRGAGKPDTPETMLGAALRSLTCVRAVYNRNTILLAPHALFRRNDDLFVDGVVIERDGQPPREPKLGTFKLDGLKDLAPATARFEPSPLFDPEAEKYSSEVELVARIRTAAERTRRRAAGQAEGSRQAG